MSDIGTIDALIQRARTGDSDAADALCRHFHPRLEAFVRREMGPAARRWAEPQDIAQQAFLEVIDRIADLPEQTTGSVLLGRLMRAAEWRIRDLIRRRDADRGLSMVDEAEREPRVSPPTTGPVTRDDEFRWIAALVDRLPEPDASIVRACALDGLGFTAAAAKLDMSPDAVRKRYHRVRDTLAKKLAKRRT